MALTILDAKGSNISNMALPATTIPMQYSINTNTPWIYCNFPEYISSTAAFGDKNLGNKCLNQKTVPAGSVQIFYSHYNQTSTNFHYGIQIFNPNTTSVTITPNNCGHSHGTWDDVSGGSWVRFFNGASDCGTTSPVSVAKNGSFWILDKLIDGGVFSGNLRFTTSAPVIVTVYAFNTRSNIDGTATIYPYTSASADLKKQYSGVADGYFLTATKLTLNASSLLNGGKYFPTHCPTYSPSTLVKVNGQNKSDLLPMKLAGTNITAGPGEPSPYHNVGNWCTQYYIPILLKNDTTSNIIFDGYVKTGNTSGNTFVLSSGGSTKYGSVANATGNTWHWLQVTLAPGKSIDDSYQFILGTNSSANVSHIWTARKS